MRFFTSGIRHGVTGPSNSGFLINQQRRCDPSCSRREGSAPRTPSFQRHPRLLQAVELRASGPRSSLARGALQSLWHACPHQAAHHTVASYGQAERTSKNVRQARDLKSGLGNDSPLFHATSVHSERQLCPHSRGDHTGLMSRKESLESSYLLFVFVCVCGSKCRCRMLGTSESWSSAISWGWGGGYDLYPLSHLASPRETIPEAVSKERSAYSFLRLFLKLYTPSLLA